MMKKAFVAAMLTVFLCTIFVAPTIADNPIISEVERLKDVCWFHLMTGLYPNGVWVGEWTLEEPIFCAEKGYLGLTYRNLSPEVQVIKLTTSPGASHAFWHYPEKTAYPVWLWGDGESTWIFWWVVPDEVHLMDDLWFVGWDFDQQIEVTLELCDPNTWPPSPIELLYQGTMTIMPLGS